MFICDDCMPKAGVDESWSLLLPRSYGSCERCGETKSCNDVPHALYVKDTTTPLSDKERE